jgi:hypothetical protein
LSQKIRKSLIWLQHARDGWENWSLSEICSQPAGLTLDSFAWEGYALSPQISVPGGFDNLVASWNAVTPPGTWLEIRVRAYINEQWTPFYGLGVWSSTGQRHSINGQADAYAFVDTDTLFVRQTAGAFQLELKLRTEQPGVTPCVSLVAANPVLKGENPVRAGGAAWGVELAVPQYSQMLYEEGDAWCSPTSTAMLLDYWRERTGRPELAQDITSAATMTHDPVYGGSGNWPFNTAYAAGFGGLEAFVIRFTSLAEAENWIAVGVPLVLSLAYQPGELAHTPLPKSDGHLLVLRGFDRYGNPITNDPAANPAHAQSVRIVYDRAEFERQWLKTSGGGAYLIYPQGWQVPLLEDIVQNSLQL